MTWSVEKKIIAQEVQKKNHRKQGEKILRDCSLGGVSRNRGLFLVANKRNVTGKLETCTRLCQILI